MKVVKKTAEYTIYQKRNERYSVKGADKKWVNGDDKVKILLAEELIKVTEPKVVEEEAPAEEAAEAETAEAEAEAADESEKEG